MFRNYLKIAWRNLAKSKVFSAINILGLTIGITCCLMIFLYIMNELSVDRFHANARNIYRVMRGYDPLKERTPFLSGPYAPTLRHDFPDAIQKAVRVMPVGALITPGNNKAFTARNMYAVDSDFFGLFSFPLIKGNAANVLIDPHSVVLTESTAKIYFGDEDPIGKMVQLDKQIPLKVTGIAQDVPSNSHLSFDLVMPIAMYENLDWFKEWINNNNFVYVSLSPNVNKAQLEKRFPAFMEKYMGEYSKRMGVRHDLALTPLNDIYFENASTFDNVKHGDKKVVYIFLSIAVLILLIGCINFMNLSTIRAVERSKEVGLRKVMGALRNHLVWQFIGESVLLTTISCLLSLGLLQLLLPFYNGLLGYTITVSWNALPIYLFLCGVILIVGFMAGSYPAFFLSAFSPIQALKGKLRLGKGGVFVRQGLVVLQFTISVLLIIGTIVITRQMNYMKNKQLGYDKEQTVVVPIDNDDIFNHQRAFKTELQANAAVSSVSLMSGEPGGFFDLHTFEVEGQRETWKSRTEFTDFEYVKTLGLKIIAGRDFDGRLATDTTDAVLINRTAATKLGFTPEQSVGKWIKNTIRDNNRRRIIGVVEDFNFLSLKENMDALVIAPNNDRRVAVIKLNTRNVQAAVAAIKEVYTKVAPVYPFDYSFLDQKFDQLYKADLRQQSILSIFSGLAIFIACLGLFGLASFTTAKRTKEIGVRKVLGSSTENIVLLLSKDLLKPVLIASIIAIPVAWWSMSQWLQQFAYRAQLSWWIFLTAAAITIAIALLTVGIKAIRAAMLNPVKSLRAE
jgi:putative ABC transport system permease protein